MGTRTYTIRLRSTGAPTNEREFPLRFSKDIRGTTWIGAPVIDGHERAVWSGALVLGHDVPAALVVNPACVVRDATEIPALELFGLPGDVEGSLVSPVAP